ncbi:hypothetical protein [Nostoc sp.]|uniref:hypothetical protein n=1 Tax=Nostoc sp. TaxID=1180 RepID=UPI002FF76C79
MNPEVGAIVSRSQSPTGNAFREAPPQDLRQRRNEVQNSTLDVDVGWVERSATQLIIRMLGYAKPPPNLQFFLL